MTDVLNDRAEQNMSIEDKTQDATPQDVYCNNLIYVRF